MKKTKLVLLSLVLLTVSISLSAQYFIDAENASMQSNGTLVDNGRTFGWVLGGDNVSPPWITGYSRSGSKGIGMRTGGATTGTASQRSEYNLNASYPVGENISDGDTWYTGFSIMLSNDEWANPTSWFVLQQSQQKKESGQVGNYPFVALEIGSGNKLHIVYRSGKNGNTQRNPGPQVGGRDVINIQKGVWYDVVIGWRFRPHNNDGWIACWIKTASQSDYTKYGIDNIKLGYYSAPSVVINNKIGMYRGRVTGSNKMYFDEVRFGTNFNAAKHPGNGSGGGNSGWFDLGTPSSPVFSGYNRVSQQTTSGNYRWTNNSNLYSVDRGSGANEINRDLVYSRYPRTFEYTTTNGVYDVVVTMGDHSYAHDDMVIKAEGQTVKSNIDRAAGQILNETFQTTVSDGKLSLEFSDGGGSDVNWVVNRIKVTPSSSGGNYVSMRKRNAMGYAIDANNPARLKNVHMWQYSSTNDNQKFLEIDRGGGYYSYQAKGSNFCIDGGNGAVDDQNVVMYNCYSGNYNQHWKKVDVGSGYYRLLKRSNNSFALDGSNGGANSNNVKIYTSDPTNHNQEWYFGSEKSASEIIDSQDKRASNLVVYPNPANDFLTIESDSEIQANTIVHIYSSSGAIVKTVQLENETINISNLKSGMYFIQLVNGAETRTSRFVKK